MKAQIWYRPLLASTCVVKLHLVCMNQFVEYWVAQLACVKHLSFSFDLFNCLAFTFKLVLCQLNITFIRKQNMQPGT